MSDIASKTIPTQASALRKGSYVLLKDKPCKIVDLSTSKTGKHGHAKIKMTGIDIFTGQKVEDLSPSTHNMEVPVVKKDELQLIDITEEGYLTLMLENGDTREDVKLPEGPIGDEIKAKFEEDEEFCVVIQSAMDMEAAIGTKSIST